MRGRRAQRRLFDQEGVDAASTLKASISDLL